MKIRLGLLLVIAVSALAASGSPALAASALSDRLDAGAAQYSLPSPEAPDGAGVLGDDQSGVIGADDSGVIGDDAGGVIGASDSGGGLPFTGYAAITVMLAGLALLAGGLLIRRTAPRTTAIS